MSPVPVRGRHRTGRKMPEGIAVATPRGLEMRCANSIYAPLPFTARNWRMYYWPKYLAAPKGSGVWAMRWP